MEKKKKIWNKKGMQALAELPAGILMFTVAFVILGFLAILLTSLRDQAGASTTVAYGVINGSLQGAEKIGQQGSNIGLIIVIVVVIGLLLGGFGYLAGGKK